MGDLTLIAKNTRNSNRLSFFFPLPRPSRFKEVPLVLTQHALVAGY